MIKNILVGTQDQHLYSLCKPLQSNPSFFLFTDVQSLSEKLSELQGDLAVFVDVEWPNDQNGYNVARELKKRRDGSKALLITDRIDEVKLHWCAKVNAEMVERTESIFLSKLVPTLSSLGIPIADNWQHYRAAAANQAQATTKSPLILAEVELERILGPMGPLLLRDAMNDTNDNLELALKKVATFGTTAAERTQVEKLSVQFSQR